MADDYQPIVDERIVGFEKKDGRDWLVIERKGRRGRIPAERAQEFMDETGLEYNASAGEKLESFASGAGDVAALGQREKVEAAKALTGPAAEAGGNVGKAAAAGLAPFTAGLTNIPQVQSAAESLGRWVGAKVGGESTDPYEQAKQRGVVEAAKTEAKAPGYATAGRVTTGLATGALGGMASAPVGAAMTARGLAGAGLGARALASGGRMVSAGIPAAVGESMLYTAGKEDLGDPEAAKRIATMGAFTGALGLAGKAIGDALPVLRAAKATKKLEPLRQAKEAAESALETARKSQAIANEKLAAATRMAQAADAGVDEAAKLRARQDVIRIRADLDSVNPAQIAELEKELADVERMIGVQRSALELTKERAERAPAANKPRVESDVIGPYDMEDLAAAVKKPYDDGPVFAGRPEGTGAQTPRSKAAAALREPPAAVDEVLDRPVVSATGGTVPSKPGRPSPEGVARRGGIEIPEPRTAEMERQIGDADALAARLRKDLADQRARLGSKFEKTVVADPGDMAAVAERRIVADEVADLAKSRQGAAARAQREAVSEAVDADVAVTGAEMKATGPRAALATEEALAADSLKGREKIDALVKRLAASGEDGRLSTAAVVGTALAATGNPFAVAAATPIAVAASAAKVAKWKPEIIIGALKGIGQLEPALKVAMQASKSAGGLDPKEIVRQHEKRMQDDPEYRKAMIGEAKRLEREFEKQKTGGGGVAAWFRKNGRRVTSTKRTKRENARLMGAAKDSKHLTGNAVDIGASDKSSPDAAVKDLVMAHAELASDPEIMRQVKRVVLEIPKGSKYQHITVPEEDGLIVRRRNVNGPHLHIETM